MSQLSNLTLSSAYSAGGEVFLFWDYNLNDIVKSDMYEIFRSTTPGSYGIVPYATNFPPLDNQGINRGQDYAYPYFHDTGAAIGTTYYYKVRVKTFDGQYSPFSPEVSVQARGAKYYIATTGNNANPGSSGSPWASMAHALGQVPRNQGHVIIHKAGTYNYSTRYDCNGISLDFEPGAVINSLLSYNPGWWDEIKPIFSYAGAGAANIFVKNLKATTPNNGSRGWSPLFFEQKTGVFIDNLDCEYYFRSAVNGQTNGKNFVIRNSNLRNNGQEENGFSSGNWTLKGSFTNVYIHNNTVDYTQRGYGAKIHYAYINPTDTLTNARISFNTFTGKTGSAFAPEYNISHECFQMRQNGVIKSNNEGDMHFSDDTLTPSVTAPFSYYHHHNTFRIKRGQTWEDASSHMLAEDNIFDNRNNANAWGRIGEFNTGQTMTNKVYRRNLFLGPAGGEFVWTCNVQNVTLEYNTFTSDTTLFEFRRPNSNGSKTGFRLRYNVFDGNIRMTVKNEGSDGSVPQLVATEGNIFKSNPNWNRMTPFAATIATPQLQRLGAVPDPFYRHTPTGNCSDKGAFQTTIAPPVQTNQPPNVDYTSAAPADGSSIQLGQSITVPFTASDTDGTIANRELLINGQPSGSSPSATSFAFQPPAVGIYTFAIRVTDDKGASRTTPARTLNITSIPVTPNPPASQAGASSKNFNLVLQNGKYYLGVQGL